MNKDKVDFYYDNALLIMIDSSIVPTIGSRVAIREHTYKVRSVFFEVHYADRQEQHMRCCVELTRET